MSTFSKSGQCNSPDFKWTGAEPEWFGWEKWSLDKFFATKSRALRFYGYYLSDSDLKDITLKWMKAEKYSPKDIETIKNADAGILPSTVGKLIRCMNLGCPAIHPNAQEYFDALPFHETPPIAKSDYDIVKKEISVALKFCNSLKVDKNDIVTETKAKTISPIDRIRENTRKDIILPLEELMDKWTDTSKGVESFNMLDLLKSCKVPSNGTKQIIDWLEKHRVEYNDALEKLCPQAVESYSFLSKPDLKKIVKCFDSMLSDVRLHSKIKVSERKPRIKKTKDATKQVSKLKYQLNSSDYSLDSVAPTRIPGSQRLYLFNTKTRSLFVYHASGNAGFEVKGCTLLGWDEGTSFSLTLRKPADLLSAILSATPKKLDKIFDGITTVRKKVTGRVNDQCILLKVLENRL